MGRGKRQQQEHLFPTLTDGSFTMLLARVMFLLISLPLPTRSFLLKFPSRYYDTAFRRRFISSTRAGSSSTDNNNNCIHSPKSNTVKKIQALLNRRKKRAACQQTIVEGPRMILDLLKDPSTAGLVRQIVMDDRQYSVYMPQLEKVMANYHDDLSLSNDVLIQRATSEILAGISDTVTNQGLVAIVDIPKADDFFQNHNMTQQQQQLYLILDAVADPGNIGALIRSARATGVAAVILLPGCVDPFSPKAVRSAMGTTFSTQCFAVDGWSECCEFLLSKGCSTVWAATMLEEQDDKTANQESAHYDVDWLVGDAVGLVVGSEGNGLTQPVRQSVKSGKMPTARGDVSVSAVHVPMKAGVESLNAAVCGSVIMFEYLRQREQGVGEVRAEKCT